MSTVKGGPEPGHTHCSGQDQPGPVTPPKTPHLARWGLPLASTCAPFIGHLFIWVDLYPAFRLKKITQGSEQQ